MKQSSTRKKRKRAVYTNIEGAKILKYEVSSTLAKIHGTKATEVDGVVTEMLEDLNTEAIIEILNEIYCVFYLFPFFYVLCHFRT